MEARAPMAEITESRIIERIMRMGIESRWLGPYKLNEDAYRDEAIKQLKEEDKKRKLWLK